MTYITPWFQADTPQRRELQHVQQLLQHYQAQANNDTCDDQDDGSPASNCTASGASTNPAAASGNDSTSKLRSQSGPSAATSNAKPAGISKANASSDWVNESSTAAESWAGEAYEKDEIRGVDRSYVKFSKRLARCPQQCVR